MKSRKKVAQAAGALVIRLDNPEALAIRLLARRLHLPLDEAARILVRLGAISLAQTIAEVGPDCE